MTLLSTTTLSGASTTITVTGGYNYIYGVLYGLTNATGFGDLRIAPNGTTNKAGASGTLTYTTTAETAGSNDTYIVLSQSYSLKHTDANNAFVFSIHNYESSSNYKPFHHFGTYENNNNATTKNNFAGGFESNTAITSLVFSNSGGNFSTGTVLIYGVK